MSEPQHGERRHSVSRHASLITTFALASLGALVLVVSFTPLVPWWAYKYARPWSDRRGGVLIVLSGDEGPRGMIGYESYIRAEYALLAYQKGGIRRIILSGGGKQRPVADSMRDFLGCNGVPSGLMSTESASMSTRENALFTAHLLQGDAEPVTLLTSDYHMFRAYRAFRKAGVNVVGTPAPDVIKRAGTWRGRWPGFLDLVTETIKIAYYKYRGWI